MNEKVEQYFLEAMSKGSLMTFLKKDVYKESHVAQLNDNVEELLETWTPRGTRIEGIDSIILFNLQAFVMEYLIEDFNKTFFDKPLDEIIKEYKMFMNGVLFDDDPNLEPITSLHNLGYLPIEIRAVKEGTRVPMRCPAFTFRSTNKKLKWVAATLEILTSTENWSPITVATIAAELNRVTREFCLKTTGSYDGAEYMNHDFSMRGMSGVAHSASAGSGHLLSGKGTDSFPAVHRIWKFYDGKIAYGGIGCSVPATEHMVMCVGMDKNRSEKAILKKLLTETYPTGIVSAVLDSDDFWHNITVVLPQLREEIMGRDGKLVCRPDSGNPADVICGTLSDINDYTDECSNFNDLNELIREDLFNENIYDIDLSPGECGPDSLNSIFKWNGKYYKYEVSNIEWNRHDKTYYYHDQYSSYKYKIEEFQPSHEQKGLIEVLWDEWGGTMSETGYKLLDSHIGAIYGDSIIMAVQLDIYQRLVAKGFSTMNVVLGIGSFQYNMNTRDTFNQAFKAVNSVVDGVDVPLFKDPKDSPMKKSQRGRVVVFMGDDGNIDYIDGLNWDQVQDMKSRDLLECVFLDGKLKRFQTHEEIVDIVMSSI